MKMFFLFFLRKIKDKIHFPLRILEKKVGKGKACDVGKVSTDPQMILAKLPQKKIREAISTQTGALASSKFLF